MNRFSSEDMLVELQVFESELSYPQTAKGKDLSPLLAKLASGSYAKTASVQDMLDDQLLIESYSLYLLDQQNRQQRIINWCQSNIEDITGRESANIPEYIGSYMPSRLLYVKANNADAQRLDQHKLVAQAKLDTIKDIYLSLQRISKKIESILYMKRQRFEAFTE